MLLEWNRLLLQRVVAESCYCVMLWESGILYLPRKPVVKTTSLWKQTPLIGASFPHIKKDLLRTSNKEYLVGCQSLQTHKNQLLWLITRKLMLWSWFLYKLLATSSRGVSSSTLLALDVRPAGIAFYMLFSLELDCCVFLIIILFHLDMTRIKRCG